MTAHVVAVGSSPIHSFSKRNQDQITLVVGLGVAGDAHCGPTVKHRSRVARDPSQPNLRQIHLVHEELLAELRGRGFAIAPGQIGENITTRGIDLLALPANTELRIGASAAVRLTGLRNPCTQLDAYRPGLRAAVLGRSPDGAVIRKAGVMGIVVTGGEVLPGDLIAVRLPAERLPLEPV